MIKIIDTREMSITEAIQQGLQFTETHFPRRFATPHPLSDAEFEEFQASQEATGAECIIRRRHGAESYTRRTKKKASDQ